MIANEYGEALRDRNRVRIRTLRTEIEEAPATLDKARFLLSARREKIKTPEVLPILQIEPRSAEGRTALEAILDRDAADARSEEHTSELQSLMRISYAVFCLKKKTILLHQLLF